MIPDNTLRTVPGVLYRRNSLKNRGVKSFTSTAHFSGMRVFCFKISHAISKEPLDQTYACLYSF